MPKIYQLLLSTAITSGPYACTVGTANSNVSFNINWNDIFKGYNGEANLRFKLCSKSSGNYAFNNSIGYVQINGIASPYSNGCLLGLIFPQNDTTATYTALANNPIAGTTTYNPQPNFLYGSNLDSNGLTVKCPSGYSSLQIQLRGTDGTLLTTPDNYLIWLYFQVENDD
jgi:hypothetical protein